MDRDDLNGKRVLARALAAALLILAVLRPPEIYAWSGAACAILLAAAGGLAWLATPGSSLLPTWTAGLLPFAAAAVALSSCRARALDETRLVVCLLLAGILGRSIASDRRARDLVAGLITVLACIAAALAVLQAHVTYREELRGLAAATPPVSPYVLARLQDARPSGPFTLPAALGGFLALALPVALQVARARPDRFWRAIIIAGVLLQSYALALTRSIGGLAATCVSLALSLPVLAPRRWRVLLAGLVLATLLLGGSFVVGRRAEVGAPGGDPIVLRTGNWRAAVEMIRDHPLFGTGPGSFGTFYPRYMRSGMNETRYAHNSYLQGIAGWGLWTSVPLAAFLFAFSGRLRLAWRRRAEDLPFLAAGASFLFHNLADFTAYLPGVAIPGALMIGLGLGPRWTSPMGELEPESPAPRRANGARGRMAWRAALVLSLCLIAFVGHSLLSARAAFLLEQARSEAVEGSQRDALALGRRAARARPGDPTPRAFVAEWVLTHGMTDESLRREGERQARSAVRLDPEAAILHYDLSLYLRATGETGPAYREQWTAHRLFPLKQDYLLPPEPAEERPVP
jgi:O-antigen ligase